MFSLAEISQIKQVITNIHTKNKKVPFASQLKDHKTFGPFFAKLTSEQEQEVEAIIKEYISDQICGGKTKGAEFFRRFYAMNKNAFREFRELNEDQEYVETAEFQEIGKGLQTQLFKFETMLTANMSQRSYGLDKVVTSFYDIVHSYFPWYSFIN